MYTCSLDGLKLMLAYLQKEIVLSKLDLKKAMHIEIAVEEALTNVIRHSGLSVNDKVFLNCEFNEYNFNVVIADKGKPFNPLSAPERGIGIGLMLRLMDSVIYERNQESNILTLIKS